MQGLKWNDCTKIKIFQLKTLINFQLKSFHAELFCKIKNMNSFPLKKLMCLMNYYTINMLYNIGIKFWNHENKTAYKDCVINKYIYRIIYFNTVIGTISLYFFLSVILLKTILAIPLSICHIVCINVIFASSYNFI